MSTSQHTAHTGEIFAGRYRILRVLGEGGMGEVFLAEDSLLSGERVALKVLYPQLSRDERHAKRFLREVQLTRKVTHPNVVRTFDLGTIDGKMYFTMELVEGISLKERMREGQIDYPEIAHIAIEICKGLGAIHQAGIVHRDLKPANIILTANNEVKIADFGVARPGQSDLTGESEVVGSAPYMAPEVWLGKNIGPASDIYALGVMIYELLTGVLPFDGDSPAEFMGKHLEVIPTPPSDIVPSVPRWWNNLVLIFLEKDANKRPYSADEVVSAIERLKTQDSQMLTQSGLMPQLSRGYVPSEIVSSVEDFQDLVPRDTSSHEGHTPETAYPPIPAPEKHRRTPDLESIVHWGMHWLLPLCLTLVAIIIIGGPLSDVCAAFWRDSTNSGLAGVVVMALGVVALSCVCSTAPMAFIATCAGKPWKGFLGWIRAASYGLALWTATSFTMLIYLSLMRGMAKNIEPNFLKRFITTTCIKASEIMILLPTSLTGYDFVLAKVCLIILPLIWATALGFALRNVFFRPRHPLYRFIPYAGGCSLLSQLAGPLLAICLPTDWVATHTVEIGPFIFAISTHLIISAGLGWLALGAAASFFARVEREAESIENAY